MFAMWSRMWQKLPHTALVSPRAEQILGNTRFPRICFGEDKRDRTADLLNAMA